MTLKDALIEGKFTVTFEVQGSLFDPCRQPVLKRLQKPEEYGNDFFFADLKVDGIVEDRIEACGKLEKNGINAIYPAGIRDKNRLQIQEELLSAADAGVGALLVFADDDRISGQTLKEKNFFHVDTGKLASVLDHLVEGRTIEDTTLNGSVDFFIGAGIDISTEKELPLNGMKALETMTEMGTGFFLTTPIFNIDLFDRCVRQIKAYKVPIIAEVMILGTAEVGKFVNRHFKSGLVPESIIQKLLKASDTTSASIELFADTVMNIKDLCQGVHILTTRREDNLGQYLNAAKLR